MPNAVSVRVARQDNVGVVLLGKDLRGTGCFGHFGVRCLERNYGKAAIRLLIVRNEQGKAEALEHVAHSRQAATFLST